ncbi:uncharacterized protein YcfJ [Nocardia transvalensis]|uniref:Uncharacterized protein YcfJ n=1 Tax=Nocardia transvalensis TaxID=37333 RepID=A0A7W9UIF1_9NOCA|nr:hypothetical protein [Nocardia transvalensis]MBB5914343.1 uncharacterized protein YcfJ [Nocardia transvalensis]
MKFGKITATVFMAIAATGITAATAHGESATVNEQPAAVTAGDATSGVDHGVNYRTTVSTIDRAITTTVENGRFEVAQNGTVALRAEDGSTLMEVPQTYELGGRSIAIAQQIAADGHALTMTPQPTAEDISELKNVSAIDNLRDQVVKNGVGVVLGVIVGGFVGALLGFGILSLITAPIGWVVGGIAGGYIQGGQEFLDAVQAVATGQP